MTEPLFELYRGDDYSLRLVITDAVGNPVDITGWAFKATMKLCTELPDEEAPVHVSIPPVPSSVESTAGVVYINFPSAQTRELLPTNYFMDVQRELDGRVNTVFVERVRVKPDVTWGTN